MFTLEIVIRHKTDAIDPRNYSHNELLQCALINIYTPDFKQYQLAQ